jgi:Ca2+-binding EF-hand superfamily protein
MVAVHPVYVRVNAQGLPPLKIAPRLSPAPSPRIAMPAVPKGGGSISLPGGLQIVCRFPPEPVPQPELPPNTFTRRFDDGSYVLPGETHIAVGSKAEMMKELREALLAEEVHSRVIDMFRQYDLNGNGVVCREEFRTALPLLGLRGYARSDMDVLFEATDTDKSGQIEYAELWRLLRGGAEVELAPSLKVNAVAFDVREKGASNACRATPRDERFESKPLREPSVDAMRAALRRNRQRVIDAFRCLDRDGNGAVTRREFMAALPLLGFLSHKETADAVFDELDEDSSGSIEYEELHRRLRQGASVSLKPSLHARPQDALDLDEDESLAARRLRPATVAEVRDVLARERSRVIEMFRVCDSDGDGKVTRREFRATLPALGFGAGGRQSIDALFDTFDLDGGGTLSLTELKTVLRYEERGRLEKARRIANGDVAH